MKITIKRIRIQKLNEIKCLRMKLKNKINQENKNKKIIKNKDQIRYKNKMLKNKIKKN
jgi:hypothetical protein